MSYGQTTGPLPSLDAASQAAKSLRLSRPALFHYTANPERLREMAAAVFAMLERGVLRPLSITRFPLSAAAEVHRALAGRATKGSLVLVA